MAGVAGAAAGLSVGAVEKSPYTVTYENYETTDGGPTGPVTYQLPILYTVWPVSKPLPEDLEYVVDHEIARPEPSKAMRAMTRAYSGPYPVQIRVYDDVLGYIPMPNIYVRVLSSLYYYDPWNQDPYHPGYWMQNGGSFVTDDNGMIDLEQFISDYTSRVPGLLWDDFDIMFSYQDPNSRWKITTENSTAPLTTTIYERFPFDPYYQVNTLTIPSGNRQANEIYRAADYFYNVQNDFPVPLASGGAKIIAHSVSGTSNYSPSSHDINICGYGRTSGDVVGSTLHEIGHYVPHMGNSSFFKDTHILLYESFACYTGWYFTEKYYKSLGWVKPYASYDITTRNARQNWEKTDGGESWYTPLFVDLADDYNQGSISYPNRPTDNIQEVPALAIWNTIATSRTWAQCRAKLQSYAGTGVGKHYTVAQFNEWIGAFDDWNANPSNN